MPASNAIAVSRHDARPGWRKLATAASLKADFAGGCFMTDIAAWRAHCHKPIWPKASPLRSSLFVLDLAAWNP